MKNNKGSRKAIAFGEEGASAGLRVAPALDGASEEANCDLAMSEWEICQSYKNAASRSKQIKVLAELNACEKRDIIRVLNDNGINHKARKVAGGAKPNAVVKISRKSNQRERHVWTDEETQKLIKLYERGYYPADIAEIMRMDAKKVTNKISAMARKRKGEKKNVQDVCVS